jgi:predicted alpha/beta superfamily hydrolase
MVHVLAVITAKPGMREQILDAFRANVPAVRAEAGCIAYEAVVDVRDPAPGFAQFGADAFLQVLRVELIPYAESHLPVAGDERGLAGHSYAGLFTAYTLTQAPDLFDHYLIMSPALYFDHGKIYDLAIAPTERTRSVFLAADTPRGGSRSAIANEILRYNDLLLEQPHLRVSHALIAGETHSGMVPPAARRGLIALYGLEPER